MKITGLEKVAMITNNLTPTEIEIRGMQTLHHLGKSELDIACCFGYHQSIVHKCLGVKFKKPPAMKRYIGKKDQQKIQKLYDGGMSISDIAKDIPTTPYQVKKALAPEKKTRSIKRQQHDCKKAKVCMITDCPEYCRCKEKNNPEDCLVYKMMITNNLNVDY